MGSGRAHTNSLAEHQFVHETETLIQKMYHSRFSKGQSVDDGGDYAPNGATKYEIKRQQR